METPAPTPPKTSRPNEEARGPRLSEIPLKLMIPNIITVLAICAGLTGIRLAFEGRFELAVAMVLLAAFLDGIDGRVARLLNATSKFGVQMDSLADIINFGVAPVLVLYAFMLDGARSVGWIVALLYAIAAGLRLARFNVMADREIKAEWQKDFFVGVPAPMGAMLVLLPVYLGFLGVEASPLFLYASLAYTLLIGYLLISRLPVWSGKGVKIRRSLMLPILLGLVLYVALLMSFTWEVLSVTVLCYLCFLPFSARAWHKRYGTITIDDESTDV